MRDLKWFISKTTEYKLYNVPLHVLALAGGVKLLGSFRQKVEFDLIQRQQNAYGILKAADDAKSMGLSSVTAIEFGVAAGEGLINMGRIAQQVEQATGVRVNVVGFDTGKGMPPAQDWRDHPDLYGEADFPMDFAALAKTLPANTRLILGEIGEQVDQFLKELNPASPIGYVVVDVDYYSSTTQCLRTLTGSPQLYLPRTVIYFDDIELEPHNSACGELLAIAEFNAGHPRRRIERYDGLRCKRVFRYLPWLDKIYFLHVLDHPQRCTITRGQAPRVLGNAYLKGGQG